MQLSPLNMSENGMHSLRMILTEIHLFGKGGWSLSYYYMHTFVAIIIHGIGKHFTFLKWKRMESWKTNYVGQNRCEISCSFPTIIISTFKSCVIRFKQAVILHFLYSISLRGNCTPNQKISMFCALSQNNQHLLEKWHIYMYTSYSKLSKELKK